MPRAQQTPLLDASVAAAAESADPLGVSAWLNTHGLSQYATPLAHAGYTSMRFVRSMDEEDIVASVAECQMPRAHEKAFRAALASIQRSAGQQPVVVYAQAVEPQGHEQLVPQHMARHPTEAAAPRLQTGSEERHAQRQRNDDPVYAKYAAMRYENGGEPWGWLYGHGPGPGLGYFGDKIWADCCVCCYGIPDPSHLSNSPHLLPGPSPLGWICPALCLEDEPWPPVDTSLRPKLSGCAWTLLATLVPMSVGASFAVMHVGLSVAPVIAAWGVVVAIMLAMRFNPLCCCCMTTRVSQQHQVDGEPFVYFVVESVCARSV